jgi:CSLREA domain-containing protein
MNHESRVLGVIHDGGGPFVRSRTRDCPRPLCLLAALVGICLFLAIGANLAWASEYTVNSTGDQVDEVVGSGGCKTNLGTCTLRAAIEESNASAGVEDTVKFAESFDGQVAGTIQLTGTLPTITDRVRIRGYPMPEKCETDYYSFPGPCVGIEGPAGGTAFRVAAERVRLVGFAVSGAKRAVEAVGAPGLEVWNNWFGLKLDGNAGPLETGVFVDQNSNGPSIGLSTNAGNLFAHSTNAGLEINGADNATVHGNGFGVLPDGTSLAANGTNIEIADAASGENRVARGNWIGGTYSLQDPTSTICDIWCNVISGATEIGIDLSGDGPNQDPASGSTRIFNNFIGLNAFGTTGLPNAQQAIRVGAAENVTIGGPREVDRNLINGGGVGVLAQPYAGHLVVENNWIGLDATGEQMLAPPSSAGIEVEGGYQVEIVGNRISMASGTAIEQEDNEVVIQGNRIGKGTAGQDLPGAAVGIRLGSCNGLCGLVEDNVLANASEHGLLIEGQRNQIFANRVEGSGAAGILILSASGFEGYRNMIGANTADQENMISGNGGAAIEVRDEGLFGEAFRNVVGRNNGAMNGAPFLLLVGGAHRGISPPEFSMATPDGAQGNGAEPGATIRVFRKAEPSPGEIESFLAETVADDDGVWAVTYPTSLPGGTVVAASQTEEVKGTSEFSFGTTVAPTDEDVNGGGNQGQPQGNPPVQAPDTTAPETMITRGPKSRSRSRTARFQFSSSESARFRCKLDARAETSCRSPRVYRRLGDGRHVLRVWAIDGAGNRDASPARWVFGIQTGRGAASR